MTRKSDMPNLMNAAGIDHESDVFDHMQVIIYGGQFAERIITSDEIIILGTVGKNMNDSKLDVTRRQAKPFSFEEYVMPGGWNDGRELLQK